MRRSLCVVALLMSACVPTEFEDLRAEGPTRALAPPEDYPRTGFGEVVTGYGGMLAGSFVSRVAGSAGESSPFTVYPLVIADRVRLDTPVIDGCDDESTCMPGAGISLVGIPAWGDRELCLAAVAPDSGEIKLRCEDQATLPVNVAGPGGQRFGVAAAGLDADHPWGRAIFGAPGASRVYRLPDGAPPVPIDLSAAVGAGGELGRAVAVGIVDEDTVLLAAGAPLGAAKRVVVALSDIATDGTVTTSVRGCLDAPSEGFGAALAIGDLNGDGALDVVVGSGAGADRLDAVRVYDGAAMPASETCDGSWAHAVEIACPSLEGVGCDEGEFGAALAIGDLDGDGVDDLLAGAPGATVDEATDAGAVFVFRGGALGSLAATERVALLRHSQPARGVRLGTSVAVAPGLLTTDGVRRDEAIAGAPGADRVYVFVCSPLEPDAEPSPAMHCSAEP